MGAAALAEPLSAARGPGTDAWFGPAADGGFWALGLARPNARLAELRLHDLPMSTPDTGDALLGRLAAAGLTAHQLPVLTDVDALDDARQVAAEAPGSRFAARLGSLTPAPEVAT
ncbi:hypothetical protein [Streptomyces lunalinharesii]|uniref:DUF2064 domain-containing protein n=1 Tax=Streptomyces lunalinharesii TaxID=333384 RepID=A0ABN3R6Z1_9ACTN